MSRTTVDVADELLREARDILHTKTRRETIERSLQDVVRRKHLQALLDRRGKGYGMTLKEFLRSRCGSR